MWFNLNDEKIDKNMSPEEASIIRAEMCYSGCEAVLDTYSEHGVASHDRNDKHMDRALHYVHLAQRHFAISLQQRGEDYTGFHNWMPDWLYSLRSKFVDWRYRDVED